MRPDDVSQAEIVAALSIATDMAMGQRLESGLRICHTALALAEEAGLGDDERARVFHVALLRHVGCTADAHAFSALMGDDIAVHAEVMPLDATSPRGLGPYVLRHMLRTNGLVGGAGRLVQMIAMRDHFREGVLAVCEVAERLADRLGLSREVQADLLLANERWDGKSHLKRASGEEVPVAVRVVQVAECATIYDEHAGLEAAVAMVRERSGGAFDPRLAELLSKRARRVLEPPADAWAAVAGAAPPGRALDEARLDGALAAIGEFVDLKSPSTVGHSAGVARLAEAAARAAGLSDADATLLRRSGLVHDIGRVSVPSTIWEKPGPLTRDEWERVRLHAYQTERVLYHSPALARLAATAALHHERCDGSGYHRGLSTPGLSGCARLLAAADAFHAMTEPRPHRPALDPARAAAQVRSDARAGYLDADAVEAVIAAAGGRPRRKPEHVAGLTAREIEVLALLARGRSVKQIAAELVIAPKTADSHVQRVYRKIGVSTRAAATVFAMRHDLVGRPKFG